MNRSISSEHKIVFVYGNKCNADIIDKRELDYLIDVLRMPPLDDPPVKLPDIVQYHVANSQIWQPLEDTKTCIQVDLKSGEVLVKARRTNESKIYLIDKPRNLTRFDRITISSSQHLQHLPLYLKAENAVEDVKVFTDRKRYFFLLDGQEWFMDTAMLHACPYFHPQSEYWSFGSSPPKPCLRIWSKTTNTAPIHSYKQVVTSFFLPSNAYGSKLCRA